jgi:hypothetical protein
MMVMDTQKYIKRASLLVIALFTLLSVDAQQKNVPCHKSLQAAYDSYEAGRFDESIGLIKKCINGYDKEVLFEAYRLLSICYLNMDYQQEANKAAMKVLYHKQDYQKFPFFDPIEFTRLLAEYEVWPRLEGGLKVGGAINSVHVLENYSVVNSSAAFMPKAGYQVGAVVEYYLQKKLSVNAELLYEGIGYSRVADDVSGWRQEYIERLNYLTLPIFGKYYFYTLGGFDFALEAGLQVQFLINTQSNVLFKNNVSGQSFQDSKSLSLLRNNVLLYGIGGLTAKHKLGEGNIVVGLRCAYGLTNVVNADKRYDDIDFMLNNQYVDSDFRFIPVYFSCSYQRPISSLLKVSRVK